MRNSFFEKQGVFHNRIPASTAIGAANPAGAALDYGSAFSRGIEVKTPESHTVYISGTASIDNDGNSVYVGDPRRQIEKTMEVVSAILGACGMNWRNATGGVAYYRDPSDHKLLRSYCATNGIPEMPLTVMEADVCRRELLFEIELDACSDAGK